MQKINFGFVRVAAAIPVVHLGNPEANAKETIDLAEDAYRRHVQVLVFPELGISGYTVGDGFHQNHLLDKVIEAIKMYLDATKSQFMVSLIGAPLVINNRLFNVVLVCNLGKVLAVIPKTYIPGNREFYEPRWFESANNILRHLRIKLGEESVPVGNHILCTNVRNKNLILAVEICEDLWMPIPPSSYHALAGATILANSSASNALVGKADYRRSLVCGQSARCMAGYVYASCGWGESSSDVVFDNHAIIAENGIILAESKRFLRESQIIMADIDVDKLSRERMLTGSFSQSVTAHLQDYETVSMETSEINVASGLMRVIDPHPFVPEDPATRSTRCQEIINIQVSGLTRRLSVIGKKGGPVPALSLGVSGGSDSTWAALVVREAFNELNWDLRELKAVTMPGPGTSKETLSAAIRLGRALGCNLQTIDITEELMVHLAKMGHTYHPSGCLICQNSQARIRTTILMDLGFVIGTGDLSEIAIGWCTYNGDHMSMYNPNAGNPKTLISSLIRWYASIIKKRRSALARVLNEVAGMVISPELEEPDAQGKISQKTEDVVGPYELIDFFLFNTIRNGFTPAKIVMLAQYAFGNKYDRATIIKWLREFYRRFFFAQFKRDAAPGGSKNGSVALSQRGDWRLPADMDPAAWLKAVDELNQ